ncbi:hypothetical protein IF1G_03973 [Cordyceps javanica]|uniref:Uncharacterized protein n=1 Tax=Cordyceps javanica TaxID=43265 RepID=A0A545V4U2_9HYPO|nr:hypothetical protein IF1G_03973 [Cordyceps javanica]
MTVTLLLSSPSAFERGCSRTVLHVLVQDEMLQTSIHVASRAVGTSRSRSTLCKLLRKAAQASPEKKRHC